MNLPLSHVAEFVVIAVVLTVVDIVVDSTEVSVMEC